MHSVRRFATVLLSVAFPVVARGGPDLAEDWHRGALAEGQHTLHWDGRDDSGVRVASGSYFVVIDANGERLSRKISLIK